jgi:hypothetical protein
LLNKDLLPIASTSSPAIANTHFFKITIVPDFVLLTTLLIGILVVITNESFVWTLVNLIAVYMASLRKHSNNFVVSELFADLNSNL